MVIDGWNPDFFRTRLEPRSFDLPQGTVRESKTLEADRLKVRLAYPDGSGDFFEWQVFTPAEMTHFAASAGLEHGGSCTLFEAGIAPSREQPKIQHVLARPS